ncbi:hypothetical protein, partial [Escherichia coli]|uniref:hypothetical protein n=1 Tax=Escherichia coli TaxID=562 RepID=UPI001A90AC36
SLKTSIKTITYLSDIGCLEIQGASLSMLADTSMAQSKTEYDCPLCASRKHRYQLSVPICEYRIN